MPLFKNNGVEIPLVRPEIVDVGVPKREQKKRKGNNYLSEYGIKLENRDVASKYKVEKVIASYHVPVFLAITFRNYAVSTKLNLSDVFADMCMYYLDLNVPGWDAQVIDRPVVDNRSRNLGQKTSYHTHSKKGQVAGTRRGRIKCEKVFLRFFLPKSVYLTVKSTAIVKRYSLSDMATEIMMFYLDEFVPGWDLAGDIPDDPKTP